MIQAIHTKDGVVYAEVKSPTEQLAEDKSKALTLEARVAAIEKFLGV